MARDERSSQSKQNTETEKNLKESSKNTSFKNSEGASSRNSAISSSRHSSSVSSGLSHKKSLKSVESADKKLRNSAKKKTEGGKGKNDLSFNASQRLSKSSLPSTLSKELSKISISSNTISSSSLTVSSMSSEDKKKADRREGKSKKTNVAEENENDEDDVRSIRRSTKTSDESGTEGKPSKPTTHTQSQTHKEGRTSVDAEQQTSDENHANAEQQTAEEDYYWQQQTSCNQWCTNNQKKPFLSMVGEAFMSIFSCMRNRDEGPGECYWDSAGYLRTGQGDLIRYCAPGTVPFSYANHTLLCETPRDITGKTKTECKRNCMSEPRRDSKLRTCGYGRNYQDDSTANSSSDEEDIKREEDFKKRCTKDCKFLRTEAVWESKRYSDCNEASKSEKKSNRECPCDNGNKAASERKSYDTKGDVIKMCDPRCKFDEGKKTEPNRSFIFGGNNISPKANWSNTRNANANVNRRSSVNKDVRTQSRQRPHPPPSERTEVLTVPPVLLNKCNASGCNAGGRFLNASTGNRQGATQQFIRNCRL